MNSLDLDINNYDLKDILNLFKVSYDLNEDDMKKAKRVVLMTHPDKSRLAPDIFIFYTKAYKILFYIYQFRNKQAKDGDTEYTADIEEVKKSIHEEDRIKQFTKSREFNTKFNKLFDENRMNDDDNDGGYTEWLSSGDNLNTYSAKNVSQMNQIIDEKKKEMRQVVLHEDFQPMNSSSNYDLTRSRPTYYSSDIFSKLPYEDLKRAHVETVVPVSQEDLLTRRSYNTVTELKTARNTQNMNPMNNRDVSTFLKQQEDKNMKLNSNIAFRLAQQSEQSRNINQNISKHFNRILNE
tara:strand:+ start:10757 stop:11638 length:882 start_codon:yes stop_codon:yes gene_type:complete